MIFNGIINIFLNVINWGLSFLNNINIDIDISFIEPIVEFLKVIYYLLPINYLIPLFIIVFSLMSFKITVSLLKTVMQVLPLV